MPSRASPTYPEITFDDRCGSAANFAAVAAFQTGVSFSFVFSVTNNLFSESLDFATAFDAADRYPEIAVRPGVSTGNYTTLNSRQAITAAP